MSIKNRALRRLTSGAGALALGLAGIAALGTAASADQGSNGTPPGNAGKGTTATLVIHKYAGSTTEQDNNGTKLDSVSRPPLAGVTFTAQQIGTTVGEECVAIDLTTTEGWTAAQGITATTQTVTPCDVTGETHTDTTDSSGTITWEGLDLGLYYVTEGSSSSVTVTEAADPFYVTLPYPSESSTGDNATTTWLYTVHTYPKNTIGGGGDKTVADPDSHGLGSTVPWTITSRALGSFNNGKPLTIYKLIDALNSNLQYEKTTSLKYTTPGGSATDVLNTYYSIAPAAPAATPGGTVTVTFNANGLAWLNTLQAGTTLTWSIETTVVGVGVLDNKSFENIGEGDVQTGQATTDWGEAKLLKVDASDASVTLAGAEFKVYNVNGQGKCDAVAADTEFISVTVGGDETDTFISDAHGVVTIPGLYVGKDGEPSSRDYCVVETKGPSGYTAVTAPIKITVKPDTVAQSDIVTVKNPPTEGPDLPLTGASGTLAMTLGGLALVGVGAGAIVISRRRHEA